MLYKVHTYRNYSQYQNINQFHFCSLTTHSYQLHNTTTPTTIQPVKVMWTINTTSCRMQQNSLLH